MVTRKIRVPLDKFTFLSKKLPKLKVGFLEGATYEDGTPVANIASINEYGTPSRPFMAQTVTDNEKKWNRVLVNGAKNNPPIDILLGRLGAIMVGDIKNTISNGQFTPNAPYTIAKKGFDRPLIDTEHMLNSIDWEIIK